MKKRHLKTGNQWLLRTRNSMRADSKSRCPRKTPLSFARPFALAEMFSSSTGPHLAVYGGLLSCESRASCSSERPDVAGTCLLDIQRKAYSRRSLKFSEVRTCPRSATGTGGPMGATPRCVKRTTRRLCLLVIIGVRCDTPNWWGVSSRPPSTEVPARIARALNLMQGPYFHYAAIGSHGLIGK